MIPLSTIKNEANKMKTLSRLNSKESALTVLVIVSQIFLVNHRVIAQSIPRISIPGLATPVIPVITPNVAIPTVNVTTTNNIPATSLRSQPVIPTVNVTTTNNIPATSLRSQPIIPTVNVTTTNNIPSTSLINSPTPVIPTVNVTFNDNGVPTAVPELKPLTFSVTGNQGNTEPSFLSVINNNGVTTEKAEVGSTSITIPQPTAADGALVTVSTVNVVFPSSQTATGITSSFNNSFGDTSNPFTIQSSTLTVNFTPPVLD
ncbi:hypothetical protein [Microcystis aeruginosa]|uniref:Uncharacterized protein n=1 Tax=Microcystis aeruginosa PCC 7806SL TaxID=1903187 RepID=A0AB33BNE4_MICA7|nr:hypothetical protein [Microcystis aeruginosa]ARI80118.1 hypothetical protein BH695_0837 [Microcystis aeruginosa PCC 7806SL]WKX63378.1 hypothetical protein Q3H53_003501 [Microcystis aeruginosa PCC 7806]